MATEEYNQKYQESLSKYTMLNDQNQIIRNKFIDYKQGVISVPLTDEDLKLLEAESKAWDDFFKIAKDGE